MVDRKAVFAWIFSFRFDCTHIQAVVNTYFRLLKIMMHNFLVFLNNYHVLVGIIGICLVLSNY